jgi:hypothetical protein
VASGIVPLDPRSTESVAAAVELHAALLPTSPVIRIGPEFASRIYYGQLVERGILSCDLYFVDRQPAGFIAYTVLDRQRMLRFLVSRALPLGLIGVRAVLQDPTRLSLVSEAVTAMRYRQHREGKRYQGEILSFGVLPEFRSRAFIQTSGQRISHALFTRAKDFFSQQRVNGFRMMVQADNVETLLFYHALGCRVDGGGAKNGGVVSVAFEF